MTPWLEVYLPCSRLLAGIPILSVYQNIRWNSNKTTLYLPLLTTIVVLVYCNIFFSCFIYSCLITYDLLTFYKIWVNLKNFLEPGISNCIVFSNTFYYSIYRVKIYYLCSRQCNQELLQLFLISSLLQTLVIIHVIDKDLNGIFETEKFFLCIYPTLDPKIDPQKNVVPRQRFKFSWPYVSLHVHWVIIWLYLHK